MKAIILAAGTGSRLAPLGITTPKLLIPVFNKTILEHHINVIHDLVDEVVVVISPDELGRKISHFINDRQWPMPINIAYQDEALGTAHAFQSAAGLIHQSDRLICMFGDDLYAKSDIIAMTNQEYAILGQKVTDWEKWGILQADVHGNLASIIEKPDQFVGDLANTGAAVLSTEIFELYSQIKPSPRGEYEFTDVLSLFSQKHPMPIVQVNEYWLPIGYPWHILEAHEKLAESQEYRIDGDIESNVNISGRLSLGKGSVIKSGSYIEGNVIIGDNCEIGPNAYIRGNTVIGNDTKIGFSVEINNSTLFGRTKIPHFNFVGHSILGYNARFAAGSVTADRRFDRDIIKSMVKGSLISTGRAKFGAVMGDDSYLGCNTVVNPGRKIWPNVTTMPGEVVSKDKTE